MKFILGKKVQMSQMFDADGRAHAVTVVEAGPVVLTQAKTAEKDGYVAAQWGYAAKKEKKVRKSEKGKAFRVLREVKGDDRTEIGSVVDVTAFVVGDKVDVSGMTKGRGFQGVVKRHGFHGGPRSHGQKHSERAPGSIGAGGYQKVFPGRRMAGRMGGERSTVRNLKVIAIDAEKSLLFISGAIPGRRGTVLEIHG